MKAIILAAGRGSRMGHLTQDQPKCLIKFQGKSLLETQVNLFRKLGIIDITLVKGYLHHLIDLDGLRYYIDPDQYNMVHTLFYAEKELNEDVIISYADILFEESVVLKLLRDKEDISVIVDLKWKKYFTARFENPYSEAESLRLSPDNRITELGDSNPIPEHVQAQYIGLIKLSNNGCKIIKNVYHNAKKKYSRKPWKIAPDFEHAYMTDLLQAVIDEGYFVHAVPISNCWLEFDTVTDYNNYLKWEKNGKLSRFYSERNIFKEKNR